MITTNRDVFLGVHVTQEQKDEFRAEASRRKLSMSALLSQILEDWLLVAPDEQVEPKRSNKRTTERICPDSTLPEALCGCMLCAAVRRQKDVPLPLGD